MLTEQILFMLLVTIFSLLLHYYVGTINIWYFPCTEVLVSLLLYEIIVRMYKSYIVYSEHMEMQSSARESETLSFDKITKLNTKINESTSIIKETKNIEKTPELRSKKEKIVSFPELKGQNNIEIVEGDKESVSESEISVISITENTKHEK